MLVCTSCGQETPEGFPRCANCGSPLEVAPAAREQRKTVTVVFCDVTGRSEHAQAVQLAREAIASAERSDSLNMQGDALFDLADVLHAAGRPDAAAAPLAQALNRYEQKKNLPHARRTRQRLAQL